MALNNSHTDINDICLVEQHHHRTQSITSNLHTRFEFSVRVPRAPGPKVDTDLDDVAV